MKNFILIILMTAGIANLNAQDSVKVAAPDSLIAPGANVIAKADLNSPLASIPNLADGKIFITEKSGTISCFDTTAHLVWNNNLKVEITSQPVIADGIFAVGDTNGDVFTLDAKTGNQIQSIGLDRAVTSDFITFKYKGDIELAMPKSTDSKSVIVFATQDGAVHCYDLETLQEYWTNKDAKDTVRCAPLYFDNKIFFNSADGFLYCIDAGNGLLIWRWKESAESSFYNSNLISDGKNIFVVSNNNDIFAIDFLLGKLSWKSNNIKVLPALGLSRDKKIIYAETMDKRILFFSALEGKVLRAIKLEQPFEELTLPSIELENKLFFTRGNGIFSLDKRYKEIPILSFGISPINFISQINEGKFLTSNTLGTFIIFTLRNN